MSFTKQLREARDKMGYSQAELARRIGVSQSNYSKYETCDIRMPTDLVEKVVSLLNDPKLKIEYANEMRLGIFNIPLLNNIDDNYTTVLDSLVEELEEATISANAIKRITRNKKSQHELSKDEYILFFMHQLQIADLITALNFNFLKAVEVYGLDLKRLEKEAIMKYKSKKYYL